MPKKEERKLNVLCLYHAESDWKEVIEPRLATAGVLSLINLVFATKLEMPDEFEGKEVDIVYVMPAGANAFEEIEFCEKNCADAKIVIFSREHVSSAFRDEQRDTTLQDVSVSGYGDNHRENLILAVANRRRELGFD